jgi:hypothetical protein
MHLFNMLLHRPRFMTCSLRFTNAKYIQPDDMAFKRTRYDSRPKTQMSFVLQD